MALETSQILEICKDQPEVTVEAGETIIREGGLHARLLVLIEGSVQVSKNDYEINVVDEPGSVFGEMSLLLNRSHTATLRALTKCRFRAVENAEKLVEKNPVLFVHIARLLALRLDCLNHYLADIKSQFSDREDHFGMMDEVLDSLMHQQSSAQ
ncbi:MAG: cyclic nucleotide-binding domain-containing protein [Verrucomicrobiota bacterium]